MEEAPDPVPFNLTIYKGSKSYRLPRIFVSFLFDHPVAIRLIEWSKHMLVRNKNYGICFCYP